MKSQTTLFSYQKFPFKSLQHVNVRLRCRQRRHSQHLHLRQHVNFGCISTAVLRLMTHTARIRGVFDVANSPRYRVGIAPMLFQWSHSHIARFSSRIRRDFFPARFFRPRPLFIARFFVCRVNFPVQTGCTAVCFP